MPVPLLLVGPTTGPIMVCGQKSRKRGFGGGGTWGLGQRTEESVRGLEELGPHFIGAWVGTRPASGGGRHSEPMGFAGATSTPSGRSSCIDCLCSLSPL